MSQTERLDRLNQILKGCRSTTFYRDRIPDEPLEVFSDLKKIPLTTKEELRHNSPHGIICVPKHELYQYHETFGTTGNPVSTWLTKEDLLDNAREVNTSGINFSKEDIVLVRFPYAISAIAHMVHVAAQLKDACVIPASARSTISPFPRIINLMQKLEVTVLCCLPLQAILLAETAELMDLEPSKSFPNLRAIVTAGEPLSRGKRKLLEDIWGVQIIDVYGMAEIGTAITDCEFGRAHLLDDYFIFELLGEDLQTEVRPNELGYLVVTTLNKKATPIIRYFTQDRVRIVAEECPCGKKSHVEVHGRKQDTIKIGTRLLDLWDLEDIVSHFPSRRFWVAGPGPKGLQFIVEEETTGDKITSALIHKLEETYGVPLEVQIAPKGTLYDRKELFTVNKVGKPRYIYSEEEMKQKLYRLG